MAKTKNDVLQRAKDNKNDEFYTRMCDIEKEMPLHFNDFKNKTIYCCCDDYRWSNFILYFKEHFIESGIKKIIATNYDIGDGAWYYEYDGENEKVIELEGNGGYETEECIAFLKEADVVVTNPPFSLFRDYVKQLMDYNKKFLIIGNSNAITYKEIFPYLKSNEMWLGMNYVKEFIQPNGEIKKFGNICWFTNVQNPKRNRPLDLYRKYNPTDYPKYDNYDAINVDKVTDIPEDYDGVMGVPITFLDKYCPTQFEIVGLMSGAKDSTLINGNDGRAKFYVNGKGVYARILIKKKNMN